MNKIESAWRQFYADNIQANVERWRESQIWRDIGFEYTVEPYRRPRPVGYRSNGRSLTADATQAARRAEKVAKHIRKGETLLKDFLERMARDRGCLANSCYQMIVRFPDKFKLRRLKEDKRIVFVREVGTATDNIK